MDVAALVADGHGTGIDHPGQLLPRQRLWLMRRDDQSAKLDWTAASGRSEPLRVTVATWSAFVPDAHASRGFVDSLDAILSCLWRLQLDTATRGRGERELAEQWNARPAL